MSQQTIGIILGGIAPAFLLGTFSTLQKASTKAGIGPGMILVFVGAASICVGLVFCVILRDYKAPAVAVGLSLAMGLVWSVSTGLISVSLAIFNVPISKLVPLFNMNTLIAVVLGLVVFSEWKSVNSPRLLIATALIIAGGILAARS